MNHDAARVPPAGPPADGRAALTATPPGVPSLRSGAGIQGDLSAYALPDLLQFLHNLRKDGQLVIERQVPEQSASVAFVEGRLVHAYCPPLQGEECLQYLLGWRSGRFIFLTDVAPVSVTIHRDFRTVLLDALRQHDELLQVLSGLPASATVLHRDRNEERLAEISLTMLEWRVLGRIDGMTTLLELLDGCPRDQLAVARAIGRLLANGIITCVPTYDFLDAIVLRALVERADLPEAQERSLSERVLQACDGQRTLRQVHQLLGSSESALIDAVEALHHALAVELVQGQEEFELHISRI